LPLTPLPAAKLAAGDLPVTAFGGDAFTGDWPLRRHPRRVTARGPLMEMEHMADLTSDGQRIVDDIAQRYAMSPQAVRVLLESLVASGGGMAQFNHPELGGMGQWSRGGMLMIGDMFNNPLKSRIGSICSELSEIIGREDGGAAGIISAQPQSSQWQSQGGSGAVPLPASSFFIGTDRNGGGGNWWPADLGSPASTGAQNSMRYGYFPDGRRLALDVNGTVSVYDTGEHRITGFSQQQSGDQSVTFSSQFGTVRLDSLRQISGPEPASKAAQGVPVATPVPAQDSGWATPAVAPQTSQATPEPSHPATGSSTPAAPALPSSSAPGPARQSGGDSSQARDTDGARDDVFTSIERLAALRDRGFITDEEFSAKKTELLKRI
jgi:hypothetical protein